MQEEEIYRRLIPISMHQLEAELHPISFYPDATLTEPRHEWERVKTGHYSEHKHYAKLHSVALCLSSVWSAPYGSLEPGDKWLDIRHVLKLSTREKRESPGFSRVQFQSVSSSFHFPAPSRDFETWGLGLRGIPREILRCGSVWGFLDAFWQREETRQDVQRMQLQRNLNFYFGDTAHELESRVHENRHLINNFAACGFDVNGPFRTLFASRSD